MFRSDRYCTIIVQNAGVHIWRLTGELRRAQDSIWGFCHDGLKRVFGGFDHEDRFSRSRTTSPRSSPMIGSLNSRVSATRNPRASRLPAA